MKGKAKQQTTSLKKNIEDFKTKRIKEQKIKLKETEREKK